MDFGFTLLGVVCGIATIFIAYSMVMIWKDREVEQK